MKQKNEDKIPDIFVNGKTLADFLGISKRRVYQLTKCRVLPKEGPGQFPLFQCVRGYISYLRRLARWYQGNLQAEFERQKKRTYYKKMASREDIMAEAPNYQPFTPAELERLSKSQ